MTENFRRSARKFCNIERTFRNVLFPSRNMKIFITVFIFDHFHYILHPFKHFGTRQSFLDHKWR